MAAEAEAARTARAKVIEADGEMKAAENLRMASVTLSEAPHGIHLRFLQTMTHIAAEKHQSIIFPLPMELLKKWSRNREEKDLIEFDDSASEKST